MDFRQPTPGRSDIRKYSPDLHGCRSLNRETCRLAVIDIGTHSVRGLLADAFSTDSYLILEEYRVPTGLGKNLEKTGRISVSAQLRLSRALGRILALMEANQAKNIYICATSAFRSAENGRVVAAQLEHQFGYHVEIISGRDEALLNYESALSNLPLERVRLAVVDIGGGSIEVAVGGLDKLEEVCSVNVGAVYLTERLVRSDPLSPYEKNAIELVVRRSLLENIPEDHMKVDLLVGSGGAFATLAAVLMRRKGENTTLHGYTGIADEIRNTGTLLLAQKMRSLRTLPGVPRDRAAVVPAGTCAALQIIDLLRPEKIVINDRGLREGLVIRRIRETLPSLLPEKVRPDN